MKNTMRSPLFVSWLSWCWPVLVCALVFTMKASAQSGADHLSSQRLAGQRIVYVVHPEYAEEIIELMNGFMAAYSRADATALSRYVGEQFVWHLHEGPKSPNAQTAEGLDGMLSVLEQRKLSWSDLEYTDIVIHATPLLVTQTFRITGVDDTGTKFDLNAVDLYTISGGKITSKSSYWKQVQQ